MTQLSQHLFAMTSCEITGISWSRSGLKPELNPSYIQLALFAKYKQQSPKKLGDQGYRTGPILCRENSEVLSKKQHKFFLFKFCKVDQVMQTCEDSALENWTGLLSALDVCGHFCRSLVLEEEHSLTSLARCS